MTQTNPEQWAVELWHLASDAATGGSVKWKPKANAAAALTIQRAFTERTADLVADNAKLREENQRIRKMLVPEWFYQDGYGSEDCQDSPDEVVENMDLKPGRHVVSVDCAGPMPSIWCTVHVRTDEEMDALETDDRVELVEHASEDAARQALAQQDKPDAK